MPLPDPDFFVESIPNELHGPREKRRRPWRCGVWLAAIIAAGMGAVGAGTCYAAAGTSLGLFLGGLVWAAVLSGPLMAGEETARGKVAAGLGIVHGIAAVWLIGAVKAELPLGMWGAAYLALGAMVFAIGGIVAVLRRVGVGSVGAGSIVTMLALAWLTWPVWLSGALVGGSGERVVAVLVPANPVFAVNAVVRERLGYWVEQAMAYHYTSLSDDVSYGLPGGVGVCVLVHALIGAACVGVCWAVGRRTVSAGRGPSSATPEA